MCETDVVKENDRLGRFVKNERFIINANFVKNLSYKKLVIVDDVICTGGTIAKLISLFRLHSDIPVISICMAKK
jgi:adenine/guanine phosphoribosyltransferase-like PRPP-binding protein